MRGETRLLEVARRIDVAETADIAGERQAEPGHRAVLALAGFWIAAALVAGTGTHVAADARVPWSDAVTAPLVASLLWIPLTLLIARFVRRRPPLSLEDGPRVHALNAVVHVAASVGITFVLNAGVRVVTEPLRLASPDELVRIVWGVGLGYLHLNAGAYWVIALAATAIPVLRRRTWSAIPSPDDDATLTVRSGYTTVRVRVSEIRWIEGAGDYVRLHLPDTAHLLSERLKRLEERLDPSRFVRVHRSAIVNVSAVQRLRHLGHGDYEVGLDDGSTVRVSRTCRARLAEVLEAREVPPADPGPVS